MSRPADSPPAIALLAAGGSRRLGRPKQLLTLGGTTLVRHFARLALQLPAARRLIVIGGGGDAVSHELRDLDLEIVANPDWSSGMGSSVRRLVESLGDHPGPCLFTTIDQPALDLQHLQRLLAAARSHPDKDIASGYHGLAGVPAVLRRPTWLQGRNLDGDTGLRRLLRGPDVGLQVLPAPQLALDVDTPENLHQAIRHGWLDPLPES